MEKCKRVAGTPKQQVNLVSEIRDLWYQLQVDAFFDKCRLLNENVDALKNNGSFLLRFDT